MTKPVIAIAGTPAWLEAVQAQLGAGYTTQVYRERAGYIARLADHHTAMIIVDGADADWRFWTTTPKTTAATRRIPVVLVSDDATQRREALLSGADFALASAALHTQIKPLAADHARVPDAKLLEVLECECQEALPPLAVQGVEKFNAGEYYPQHDLFEAQWVQTGGPVRDLYRAVLQVGVAYYQIERGNHRGALKMLLRSVQWLNMLPDVCQGIHVGKLREDAYRVRAELEAMPPEDIARFDRSLLKPLEIVPPK